MAKENKSERISARVCKEVKEFYDNYRGLTSQVLEDFYWQYKGMQEKKVIRKDEQNNK